MDASTVVEAGFVAFRREGGCDDGSVASYVAPWVAARLWLSLVLRPVRAKRPPRRQYLTLRPLSLNLQMRPLAPVRRVASSWSLHHHLQISCP